MSAVRAPLHVRVPGSADYLYDVDKAGILRGQLKRVGKEDVPYVELDLNGITQIEPIAARELIAKYITRVRSENPTTPVVVRSTRAPVIRSVHAALRDNGDVAFARLVSSNGATMVLAPIGDLNQPEADAVMFITEHGPAGVGAIAKTIKKPEGEALAILRKLVEKTLLIRAGDSFTLPPVV